MPVAGRPACRRSACRRARQTARLARPPDRSPLFTQPETGLSQRRRRRSSLFSSSSESCILARPSARHRAAGEPWLLPSRAALSLLAGFLARLSQFAREPERPTGRDRHRLRPCNSPSCDARARFDPVSNPPLPPPLPPALASLLSSLLLPPSPHDLLLLLPLFLFLRACSSLSRHTHTRARARERSLARSLASSLLLPSSIFRFLPLSFLLTPCRRWYLLVSGPP